MSTPTASNANVFEQLGFSPDEVINLTIRHDLMNELKAFIKEQNISAFPNSANMPVSLREDSLAMHRFPRAQASLSP